MLPHLKDRAATRIRWPDGVDGGKFFEKNAPSHTPDWVRTATVPSPGSTRGRETLDYVVVDDLPTLVWCANLAALELHVPQWKVGPRGKVHAPDLVVFDLDPGAPRRSWRRARWRGCSATCSPRTAWTPTRRRAARRACTCTSRSRSPRTPSGRRSTPRRPRSSRRGASPAGRREDGEAAAQGQDLRRLEPEQPGEDDRGAVLAAGSEPAVRLDPGHLGRARLLRGRGRSDVRSRRGPQPSG